ncbi:MAG: ABC transporter ATP-binding protein [Actinobacteria bacterium]|nr:ABC transporter ATP-binding protein [Actinomycetota bacterium]
MSGPGTDPVVDVAALRMRYGSTTVLDGISLTVERGEIVALLGPNGAGKTTTVEILEGFRPRSAGIVRVLGIDPDTGDDAWRARLGIVLQSWRDHSKWRGHDLLSYQSRLYRPYGREGWTVKALLTAVGLDGQADKPIRMLSGGQRRRLDLAIGLAGRPELLFLDEPTASLDPQARRDFHDLVRRAVGELGTSVLITTHDLWEADALATRIAILVSGRIIACGTRAELTAQIAGTDHVAYTLAGQRHQHAVTDATGFTRELLATHGAAVTELEVRPASLEDTYLTYVQSAEKAEPSKETAA